MVHPIRYQYMVSVLPIDTVDRFPYGWVPRGYEGLGMLLHGMERHLSSVQTIRHFLSIHLMFHQKGVQILLVL